MQHSRCHWVSFGQNYCIDYNQILVNDKIQQVHIVVYTPGAKCAISDYLISPLQAEACRSVEQAFRRCPNGMFAEIKYDGERVQLHKKGSSFKYFSRSLKPVQQHKVLYPRRCLLLSVLFFSCLYRYKTAGCMAKPSV